MAVIRKILVVCVGNICRSPMAGALLKSAFRGQRDFSVELTARSKVYRLGEWQDKEIDDPYQQPKEAFADALHDIRAGVDAWVERING